MLLDFGGNLRLSARPGQIDSRLSNRDRIGESTDRRIRSRQGIEIRRHAVAGELAGLFGQTHGPHRIAAIRRGERRQQPSQIVLRRNIVRVGPQRLLIVLDGFPDTARLLQGVCEITVHLGEIGFDPQGLLIVGDGVADLPLVGESDPRDCCALRRNRV